MLDLSCESRVGEMTGLNCRHLALDGTTDQGEVADNVEQLVASGLVLKIEFHIVQDTTFLDRDLRLLEESSDVVELFSRDVSVDEHDSVGQVTALDEVTADEGLQLMEEHESTAGSNFVFEILESVQRGMLFVKHARVVLHFHVNLEMIARLHLQLDAQNLVLVRDRLLDDEIVAGGVLLNDASLMDGFDKELGAAVHDRGFFNVDVDEHIIDAHATQRCQNMFNGINLHATLAERRTTSSIDNIVDIGFDDGLVFKVNSTKTNSGIYGSRVEGEGAALTRVEARSFDTDSIF